MTTLKIGIASYEQMKERTQAIARGELEARPDDPKVWFTSIESVAKVLSDRNRALLDLIARVKPDSLTELAALSGRKKSNLSRTLKTMAGLGLVSLEKGERESIKPRVICSNFVLYMSPDNRDFDNGHDQENSERSCSISSAQGHQYLAWTGHFKLALLSCRVKLHRATCHSSQIPSCRLHKATSNPVRMMPHDPDLGEVAETDLVDGYEYERGRYIALTDADLAEIQNPSDKVLSIENFIDVAEIDPIYFDQPYFLAPDDDVAIEMLDVLRSAMVGRKRAAIARLVLKQRERLAVLTARDRGFLLTTLLSADEVRDPDAFFESLPNGDPSIELLNLAQQLIAMRSGRFDPHMFKDRYQAALMELIQQKLADDKTAPPPKEEEEKSALEFADALRLSLESKSK